MGDNTGMDLTVDLFEVCRQHSLLEGDVPLANLPRLQSSSLKDESQDPRFSWRVQGSVKKEAGQERMLLNLQLDGKIVLRCERCLGPVSYQIAEDRWLWIVKDESTAAELDEQVDEFDVIAGHRNFDLLSLIEDELLLALPPVPKHGQCDLPQGNMLVDPAVGGEQDDGRPNPFAVLAKLKRPLH